MITSAYPHQSASSSRRQFQSFVLAAVFALAGASAQAQLTSSESFIDYTVGTLLPNNTPSPATPGYTGNWTNADFGTAWSQTMSNSLSYGGSGYAAGLGNHIGVLNNTSGGEITAANRGRIYRVLNSTLKVDGATAGTRYLSWLFKSGQETGNTTYQMLELYNGSTADAARAFSAGLNYNATLGNQYDFQINSATAQIGTGVSADTAVHLFVVKFNLSATAGADSVTVWIDPVLGAGDPAGGFTTNGLNIVFDRLSISDYDGNSAKWDEIRWGTSFDGVTITAPPTPPTVTAVASPTGASVNQSFTVTATVTPGAGTVTNVSINLSQIGGPASTNLVLSSGNIYTNTFTVSGSATIGSKTLTVSAKDTTPLTGSFALAFNVVPNSRTWDGGSLVDSKWSSVTNWVGEVGPSSPTDGVTFAGTTRLTPDMDANYSIVGLLFDSTAGSFNIGSSTSSTLTNGINGITNQSANAQVLNVPVVLGAAQTFSAGTGSMTLSNSVTGGVDLTKAGSGTLTLAGAGISRIGNLSVTNGLLRVVSGTNIVAATQGNTRFFGGGNGEIAGGTLIISNGLSAWFPVGDLAGTTNTLTLSGGTLIVTNNWGLQIGRDGSGILNMNSGTLFVRDIGQMGLSMAETAGVEGTVNLNGGVLQILRVRANPGTGYFYFNGGTLKPTESRADFIPGMATVTTSVRNGGAVVDTDGFNVAIADYLEHSAVGGDNNIDGGLTKLGAGWLTLSGGFAYTGPTKVFGGTLSLNPSLGTSALGNDLTVSNATLLLDASSGVALPVSNVVVQAGAILTITNNPGASGINATSLSLSGGTTITLDYGALGANPTAAAITVAGSLTASGTNVINIAATGTLTVGSFPLIDYTGAAVPTNNFVLGTLPAGVSAVLTNNAGNTSLDLVITLIGNTLTWHGANADNTVLLPNWDINTSTNWYDAMTAPTVYLQYSGNTVGDKVTFGDSGYNLDGTNAVNLSGRVVPSTVTADSSAPYRLTGTGGIDGATSFVKNNGGTFLIGTSNNFTGGVVVNGGTLAVANKSALGAGSGLVTLAGGTLQFAASMTNANAVTVTANSTLDVPTNVTAQMSGSITGAVSLAQIGSGSMTLAGNVTVAGLTKSDNGTLTLRGSNTINGVVTLNAGTVNIAAGSTDIPGGGNPNITLGSAGAKATLQVSGTASLTSPNTGKFVRLGTAGGIGVISNGPSGLLSFNTFGIGFGNTGASSAGAIYNAGTFTNLSGSYLGNDDNTYGYINNSGTAYFGDNLHISHNDVTSVNGAAAVVDVTAGTAVKTATGTLWLNDQNRTYSGTGANAGLNITGGTLSLTGDGYQWNINNGVNNYASVNITGGGVFAMTGNAGFGLGRNNSAANRETFTLASGGTFQGAYVFTTAAASSPVFTFNNGTYRATALNTDGSIQGGILIHIQSGGATFDTAGFDCKLPAALLAPVGNGVTNIVLGGTTTGYLGAPVVKIVGDGVGAAAIANFNPATGTITGITVTSPGSGYTTATVTLEGGSGTPGTGATAGTATATAELGPVTSGGLTKTGAGTLFLNAINTYTGLTTVSNGTLSGTGAISGPVLITAAGSLAPGASIGTLTISNNLNVVGNLAIEVNNTNAQTSDLCVVTGTLTNSGAGTVTVSNLGPALVAGNNFQLFSQAMVGGGSLNITGGNLDAGLAWTNKLAVDGSIAVVSLPTIPTTPTNVTFSVSGGVLSLSWPSNYTGWILQSQTNSRSVGLTTATNTWFDVPGSSSLYTTNFTVNPTNPTVFYRLRLP